MNLKLLNSVMFLAEEKTDGHSPMKFLCSDNNIYYCKYRITPKKEETDYLLYEIICHFLLKYLKIPTPEIALVELTKDSFNPRHLVKNRLYAKPGTICFGSRLVKDSVLLNELQTINTRPAFNRLSNPTDLIRIALFDLWVENVDRGKSGNFNLLLSPLSHKLLFYAFDNAFTFGGENYLRILNASIPPCKKDKLLTTDYYRSVIKYIPKKTRVKIAENTVSLCYHEDVKSIISKAFSLIPGAWNTPSGLLPRINDILTDVPRLNAIKSLMISSLIKK